MAVAIACFGWGACADPRPSQPDAGQLAGAAGEEPGADGGGLDAAASMDASDALDAALDGRGMELDIDSSTTSDAAPNADDASDLADTDTADGSVAPDAAPPVECASEVTSHSMVATSGPANLLVIFDRSGSMNEAWNGAPRYQVASEALSTALEPIEDELSAAGLFFPSTDHAMVGSCVCNPNDITHWLPDGCCLTQSSAQSCLVTALDQSDQIAWTTAEAFRAGLAVQATPIVGGGTPLQAASAMADAALLARPGGVPTSVLLLSDGAANCATNMEVVVEQIQAWTSLGIPTHVVGLTGGQYMPEPLDRLALAGGTFTALAVTDLTELAAALDFVVQESVTGADPCVLTLSAPASGDVVLLVERDGVDYRVTRAADTWTLSSTDRRVTLSGALCASTRAGALRALRFVEGCAELPSWPPPEGNDDAGL